MKIRLKLSIVFFAFFIIFGLISVCISPVFAQSDQAYLKLESANIAFKEAFNAIYDAKTAGANVTNLTEQLNNGADLLMQAKYSYLQSDFDAVIIKSEGVILLVDQVNTAAQNAKLFAYNSSQSALWLIRGISIVGSIVFVIVLLLLWTWFKQRYVKKMSTEVTEVRSQ